MVDGDSIITSRITYHPRRLYHNFSVCICTNEYLFNMPFMAHSVFNVFRIYIQCIYFSNSYQEYLSETLTIMTMMIDLLTSTND
jgi:hypothetical protein